METGPRFWRETAIALWRQGKSIREIMPLVGMRETAIRRVVRGIPSPVNHKCQVTPEVAAWHAEAKRIRLEERLSVAAIAKRVGKSKTQVGRVVAEIDVVLPRHRFQVGCPMSPEAVARSVQGHARKRKQAGKTKPVNHSFAPVLVRTGLVRRPNHAPDRTTKRDRLRSRIQTLVMSDRINRTPAPITLPRISIQEFAE